MILNEDEMNAQEVQSVDYKALFIEFLDNSNFVTKQDNYYVYSIYADYNDYLEPSQARELLSKENPEEAFDDLVDSETYAYAEDELFETFIDYLRENGIEEPSTDTIWELKDLGNISYEMDYNHCFNQTYKARIIVDTGDGNYDFTLNPSYYNNWQGANGENDEYKIGKPASLAWLAETQGYSLEQLQQALSDGDISNPKGFLQSVRQEAVNVSSSMNALTFLVKATLKQMMDWKNNKLSIVIPTDCKCCGLYDAWNGGGSILEIELEKPVTIPAEYIREFNVDEDGDGMYSVDGVYGLSGEAYNTKVSFSGSTNESLNEAEMVMNAQGRMRPKTYKSHLAHKQGKPYSIDIYDKMCDADIDIYTNPNGYGYWLDIRSSKKYHEAIVILKSLNADFTIKKEKGRAIIDINLPRDEEEAVDKYFNVQDAKDRKFAMAESLENSQLVSELNAKIAEIKNRICDNDEDLIKLIEDMLPIIKVEDNTIWLLAEASYNEMAKYAEELDPIVAKYDKDAYFDAEDSGRWFCKIFNKKLLKEDLDSFDLDDIIQKITNKCHEYQIGLQDIYKDGVFIHAIVEGDWKHAIFAFENVVREVCPQTRISRKMIPDERYEGQDCRKYEFNIFAHPHVNDFARLFAPIDESLNESKNLSLDDIWNALEEGEYYSNVDGQTIMLYNKSKDGSKVSYYPSGKDAGYWPKIDILEFICTDKDLETVAEEVGINLNESAEGDKIAQDNIDSKNDNFEKDKEANRQAKVELAKNGINESLRRNVFNKLDGKSIEEIEQLIDSYQDAVVYEHDEDPNTIVIDCGSSETEEKIIRKFGISDHDYCDSPVDHEIYIHKNKQAVLDKFYELNNFGFDSNLVDIEHIDNNSVSYTFNGKFSIWYADENRTDIAEQLKESTESEKWVVENNGKIVKEFDNPSDARNYVHKMKFDNKNKETGVDLSDWTYYKKESKDIKEDIESTELISDTYEEPVKENTGLASIINTLIQDEWQAIQGYKDAIVDFETQGRTDLTAILNDLLNEENIHVGQLETLLTQIDLSAAKIAEGESEASQQLATEIPSQEIVLEKLTTETKGE